MSNPVEQLLIDKGVAFRIQGKDFVTACFNPEHIDNNPSFRIDKITGIAHCFSCGFKTNLFKHYGILTNTTSIRIAKLKQKLMEVKTNFNGLDLPKGAVPFTKEYRGIRKKTLEYFEAFTTIEEEKLIDRIIFPITDIRGKTLVYQARHLHSMGNPRYVNYPGGVELPLFPVKYLGKFTSAVFVEGIFDMLNLYDKGLLNVTCTFGTNTLQKDLALKLLPLKVQGITKVYLMFDGDEAGREAAKKVQPLLEEQELEVEVINLEDGTDPAGFDQEYVDSLIE